MLKSVEDQYNEDCIVFEEIELQSQAEWDAVDHTIAQFVTTPTEEQFEDVPF